MTRRRDLMCEDLFGCDHKPETPISEDGEIVGWLCRCGRPVPTQHHDDSWDTSSRSPTAAKESIFNTWADVAAGMEAETGHDVGVVAIGRMLERFDGIDAPFRKAGPEAVNRVAGVLGSSGDHNSRALARILIALVEGWDPPTRNR